MNEDDEAMRPYVRIAQLGALLGCTLAASCAAPTGDFGRPDRSYLSAMVLPAIGQGVAAARDEPVSYYQLTDNEKRLRARTYRFVMPAHRHGFFGRGEAELIRARVWPDTYFTVDRTAYLRKLRWERYDSEAGRYGAMLQDIDRDSVAIELYLDTVNRVFADDAYRFAALDVAQGVTPKEEREAVARVYENRRVASWATAALKWRLESYAYALERSRIEVPSDRAAAVERALFELADRVETLSLTLDRAMDAPAGEQIVVKA